MKKKKINKGLLIILGVIVSIILLGFIYRDYRPEITMLMHLNAHNRAVLMTEIRSHGLPDMILLMLLIAVFNAIPGMSNSFVCVFVGLCYGPVVGFLINWLGNILGNCGIESIISRIDLSKRNRQSKILNYLLNQQHPRVGLTLGFMVPIIPSILVNYSVARLKIDRWHYLPMVAIGMAPTSFIYAFGGDALFKGNNKRIIIAIIAIVVVIALYLLVKKMIKRNRTGRIAA